MFKNIYGKTDKFFKVFKPISFKSIFNRLNNFIRHIKFFSISKHELRKSYKYFDPREYDLDQMKKINLIKYFDPREYDLDQMKKINLIKNKFFLIHLPAAIIFFGFLYFAIPIFYNYDKSKIEKFVCSYDNNLECFIKDKVSYNFFPSPRLNIKKLIIKDSLNKKNTLIKSDNTSIKLSIKNLLAKEKHIYKNLQIKNYEMNLDYKKVKRYSGIFNKKDNTLPVDFLNGKIVLFDGKEYIATIYNARLNFRIKPDSLKAKLKGNFLDDDLEIDFLTEKKNNTKLNEFNIKISKLNFLIKGDFSKPEKDKDILSGNLIIKKDKNKISGIIDYTNNELVIKKSNARNSFADGRLEGKIKLSPYFLFDLDLSLNSLNFTKLYNYFLSLDEAEKNQLFQINKKINGNLILSSDKIYSGYNLVKSFESRLNFNNGNIQIEQFLVNLGKLGAADLLGSINNDEKYSNFRFESNIFVDNQKKFLSKFGIYNKKSIRSNLFISGNFDLKNQRAAFYEIIFEDKLKNEDINYVEKEFNNLMFEEGYNSLFHFSQFKEFVKSIGN